MQLTLVLLLVALAACGHAVCVDVLTEPYANPARVCSPVQETDPQPGSIVTIEVNTFSNVLLPGPTPATVNDADVSHTVNSLSGSVFTLQYETPSGGELWPWSGLKVSLPLYDAGDLVMTVAVNLIVGSAFLEEGAARIALRLDSHGICMADYDVDGDVDVFAGSASGFGDMWVNDGTGTFGRTAQWGEDLSSCAWGDANGDGLPDLALSSKDTDGVQLLMAPDFTDESNARGVSTSDKHPALVWGDLDGDGALDLLASGDSTQIKLWLNNGVGHFVEAPWFSSNTDRPYQAILMDVDGDFRLDILLAARDGVNAFMNKPGLSFNEEGASRGFFTSRSVFGLATGDVNGDGFMDVLAGGEDVHLFLVDAFGMFNDVTALAGIGADTKVYGASMFDYEHDGDVDIIMTGDVSSNPAMTNCGNNSFIDFGTEWDLDHGGQRAGLAVGDLDGDGDLDIAVGGARLLHINTNARPGLPTTVIVRPLAASGGQAAFGSTVRVTCVDGCPAPWVATRLIDGGSGYASQNAYDAVFGMPFAIASYNATVVWAAGFHPTASWASHPRLGNITPAALPTVVNRTVVVRPAPVTVTIGGVAPWSSGLPAPTPGDNVTIAVTMDPGINAHDVQLVAIVNGVDVSSTWSAASQAIVYVTPVADTRWPWDGLVISVEAVDGGGLVSIATSSVVPGATLTEEAASRGMAALDGDSSVCFGDADGDGDVDVFVGHLTAASQLWLNTGGTFSEYATARGVVAGMTRGCAWADVDGDGDADLFVVHPASPSNLLFLNDGLGSFIEDGQARGLTSANSFSMSCGDFDGDGDVDLYLCNGAESHNFLHVNNGNGRFTEDAQARGAGFGAGSTSHQSAVVDIDGDGDLDVLVSGMSASAVLVNSGAGSFADEGPTRGVFDSAVGLAVGDWDGDGAPDVYARTPTQHILLVNNGTGYFTESAGMVGVSSAFGTVAELDFDLDGDLDFVAAGSLPLLWLNDGTGNFTNAALSFKLAATDGFGLAAGDIDGDGDADIVSAGSGALYINRNSARGCVVVRPLTADGAQSAFGAAVRLVRSGDDAWVGLRVIDGGRGYMSQGGYDAVFGVPSTASAYNATVRWAGDPVPPATWASHPRLGGIAVMPGGGADVRVVRPEALSLSIDVGVWGAVGVAPALGDAHTVQVFVTPGHDVGDVNVVSATVNGRDVSEMVSRATHGAFSVVYTTSRDDPRWPWTGLSVEVAVVDGGGVKSLGSTSAVPGSVWSEESGARGMANLTAAAGRGVCMGDVDNDGDVDVFVAVAAGAPHQLWINGGNGTFVDGAAAMGAAGQPGDTGRACAFGDGDGDGWVDLFVTQHPHGNHSLYMNGGGVFVEEGGARGLVGTTGNGVSLGDVDGDGDIDAVVCGASDVPSQLFMNDGGGAFVDQAPVRGVALLTSNAEQAVLVDLDGDSDLDAVVAVWGGRNVLLMNNGSGFFSSSAFGSDGHALGVAAADFYGDGVLSVFVANHDSVDRLFRFEGGDLRVVDAGLEGAGSNTTSVVLFDIEHDGDVDVVVGAHHGADAAWLNTGSLPFADKSAALHLNTAADTHGMAVGDIDGDGDLDVVKGRSGVVLVNHNSNPQVPSSIRVRPLTVGGAQSAFGATVRLVCVEGCAGEGWTGVRVIDGGSGHYSQNGYDAVFGVGGGGGTYNGSVRWAGDSVGVSSWATHPRLGGMVGGSAVTVRASGLSVGVSVAPWDGEPVAGDEVEVGVEVGPPGTTGDIVAVRVMVGGDDVMGTWEGSGGLWRVVYTVSEANVRWPWSGLEVEVDVVDGGGLRGSAVEVVAPGRVFKEEGGDRGVESLGSGIGGSGVCMGDVDGDGDVDVFAGATVSQLWVNGGGGVFEEVGVAWGVDGDDVRGCAFGDADGDGMVDLAVSRLPTGVALYMNRGGVFVEEGEARGVNTTEAAHGLSWGDVDGDGDVDLYAGTGTGVAGLLFVGDGRGWFGEEGGERGVGDVGLRIAGGGFADVDGEGSLDLVVGVSDGVSILHVNDGSGNFTWSVPVGGDGGDTLGVAFGDWNGDGAVDVYLSRSDRGDSMLVNGGMGVFSEAVFEVVGSAGVAGFDFENDGDMDVVVGVSPGVDVAWVNDGSGAFTESGVPLGLGTPGSTDAMAVGDIDGDGDLDVVKGRSGVVLVNHNSNPQVPSSIRVRPLTVGGAQSAFGATVRLVCVEGCAGEGWTGVRVIDGGSGHYSQNGYDAAFGVGGGGGTYNGSVRWAGDSVGVSSWATHPRLGHLSPRVGVVVVRPRALTMALVPFAWPHATTPHVGDEQRVSIVLSPSTALADVVLTSASVASQELKPTEVRTATGFDVTYVTVAAQETWPWHPMRIQVSAVDSAGLVSHLDVEVTPSSVFEVTHALPPSPIACVGGADVAIVTNGTVQIWGYSSRDGWSPGPAGAVSANATGCLVGDMNDDGWLDVIVSYGSGLSVLARNGSAFQPAGFTNVPGGVVSIAAGQLTSGHVDVFVCRPSGGAILNNSGQAEFVVQPVAGSPGCEAATVADVNADQALDVVTAGSVLGLLTSTPSGFINEAAPQGFLSGTPATGVAVDDVNTDGCADVFVVDALGGLLFTGDCAGSFTGSRVFQGAAHGAAVFVFDAQLDGQVDFFLPASGAPPVALMSPLLGVSSSGALGLPSASSFCDVDSDGDVDVLHAQSGAVFTSTTARDDIRTWFAVRPLTTAGAPSAFGAVVTVSCDTCDGAWSATRVASSTPSVRFSVPAPLDSYSVVVLFAGGARHSQVENPALGGVVPASLPPSNHTLVVRNRPYVTSVSTVHHPAAAESLGLDSNITVAIRAGLNASNLVPGPGCCLINGVQTAPTFQNAGGGVYTLVYTPQPGEREWDAGALSAIATLSTPQGVAMVPVELALPTVPAGDPVPPAVVFECPGPGAVTSHTVSTLCVACPTEAHRGCSFVTFLTLNGAVQPSAVVPADNMTSPWQATVPVGPFANEDEVAVEFVAVDAAGNTAPSAAVSWTIDTSAPVTLFESGPRPVENVDAALFLLACSEPSCAFEYSLDGGPLTAVGGNGTTESVAAASAVGTVAVEMPTRVSNVSTQFARVHVIGDATNATVTFTVAGQAVYAPVDAGGDTGRVALPPLVDGTYTVTSTAVGGDGTLDLTPIVHEFKVDTRPPEVSVLQGPRDGDTAQETTFVLVANEGDCEFYWRAGAAANVSTLPWTPAPAGIADVVGVHGDIRHALQAVAVDAAGNRGDVMVYEWQPAACPAGASMPGVVIRVNRALSLGHRYVEFQAEGVEEWEHGFQYRVDGAAWVSTLATFAAVRGASLGAEHTVEVRVAVTPACEAAVAASRPLPAVATWTEPLPLPLQVAFQATPALSTPDSFAEFELEASRGLAWLQYRLDGDTAWRSCTSPLRVGPLQPGPHTVEVRAVDADGGGSGATQSFSWTVTSASDSSVFFNGLPDGSHTLTVVATDAAGLVELDPGTARWRVDTAPPQTEVVRQTPQFSTNRVVEIAAACQGEVDPCLFCWEGPTVGDGCTPNATLVLAAPVDGDHTVSVFATDSVGWKDISPTVVLWTVDSTPPETSADVSPSLLVPAPAFIDLADYLLPSTTLNLIMVANEPVSGFVVVVGGGAPVTLPNATLLLTGLDRIVDIQFAAVDLAGNVDASPVHVRVWVDVSPPTTTLTLVPNSPTASPRLVIGVAAVDDGAFDVGVVHVTVSAAPVGGGAAVVAVVIAGSEGTATLPTLPPGVYNVTAVGMDAAGNVDPSPASTVVEVDLLPPVTAFGVDLPPVTAVATLSVEAVASEEATVSCRANGGAWVAVDNASVAVLGGLPEGDAVVECRSVDVAGNVEGEPYVSGVVVVDTVAPVVAWAPPLDNFTAAPAVASCVTVADATNVTLSLEPPAAEVVNGTCVSYVAPGDGGFTVTLNVVDAAGNAGVPAASSFVLDRVPPATEVVSQLAASPECVAGGGTTVCSSLAAAVVEVACRNVSSPAGVVSPCWAQYKLETLEVADTGACSARRRLAGEAFVAAPEGLFALPAPSDGRFEVVFRSVDAAGNVGEETTATQWHVDSAPPAASPDLLQSPPSISSSSAALFLVRLVGDASPGQTRFEYRVDGGAAAVVPDVPIPNTATVSLTLSELGVGSHILEVWAVDQAGHVGPSRLFDWTIIDTAPDLEFVVTSAPVSADVTPTFVFQALWPNATGRTDVPTPGVEVSMGDGFVTACADTVASNGSCTWTAELASGGPGIYTLTAVSVFAGITGSSIVWTWEYRVCGDAQVALLDDNLGVACAECPPGANCAGALTTASDLVALPGWWSPPGSPQFFECRREEACLAGGTVTTGNSTTTVLSQCAEGYTGTLCGVCDAGFFEQFGQCVKCDGNEAVSAAVPVLVSLVVLGVGATMWKFRAILPRQTIKICFTMAQIVALCSSAYDIPWPPAFQDFLAALQIFMMDVLSVTRAECAQPMSYFESTLLTFVLFKLVLVGVLFGTWLWHAECVRKIRHRMRERAKERRAAFEALQSTPTRSRLPAAKQPLTRPRSNTPHRRGVIHARVRHRRVSFVSLTSAQLWAPVFRTLFFFLFVSYGGITLRVMRIFKCTEVANESWLVQDMRLKCYDATWVGYAVYALAMGGVFVIGLPLAITIILFRNRKRLGDPVVHSMWGFLYERYGLHAWLWEVEELGRRLVMTAIPLLLADGSAFQVALAVLVSGWAHVLHAVWKPWGAGTPWYYLQHASLLISSFIFLMGLLFKVDGVSHGTLTYTALAWVMVVSTVAFIVASLVYAAVECCRGLKARQASRARAASTPAPGAAAPPKPAAAAGNLASRVSFMTNQVRGGGAPPRKNSMQWRTNPLTQVKARKATP